MTERRRVVVTGMGIASGIGINENDFWNSLASGKSGIKRIASFDPAGFKTQNACEIDTATFNEKLLAMNVKPSDRSIDTALLAGYDALVQAGLRSAPPPCEDPIEMATLIGSGIGPISTSHRIADDFYKTGPRAIKPTTVPRCMMSAVSAQVSMRLKLTGTNYVISCACSSSTVAIGTAFRMIRDGYIEKALCVGAEALFDPLTYLAWDNLGVMSRSPAPETACRPFDAARNGCILGEGAGALVLESQESAGSRNARIRAEICGYGESSDAAHITRPSTNGQVKAITDALECAGMKASDIGFINAHGTGTTANDATEAASIRQALGSDTDNIPVLSDKPFFGHLLGAAGIAETIASILCLENGLLHANLNLDNPDPECALNLIGKEPVKTSAQTVMKNSFGFGGTNAVLIVRRLTH